MNYSNGFKKEISLKLSEYKYMFDENDIYYGQDFKNNYKFINGAINKMIKQNLNEEYILVFINDCIKYHKNSWVKLQLPLDEYFKYHIRAI